MESLFLLIPLSLLAVAAAVLVFFRMSRDGQFEDDQGPAWSILLDNDRPNPEPDAVEDAGMGGSDRVTEANSQTASDDHSR